MALAEQNSRVMKTIRLTTILVVVQLLGRSVGWAQTPNAEAILAKVKQPWLIDRSIPFSEIYTVIEAYYANREKGRGSGYKQWVRWAMDQDMRLAASGQRINFVDVALAEYSRYALTHETADRSNTGNWSLVGPTDYVRNGGWNGGVGRVNCVAFHPTNPNVLWAGTPAGGLWRTDNLGSSWTPLTDGMPQIGISGIAVHPTDPNIIYILTGDGDGGNSPSIGVLKTFNGGETWYSTGLTTAPEDLMYGYKLLMDPLHPDTLFAATTNGVYRTADGGQTWNQEFNTVVYDIEFKPNNHEVLYLASQFRVWRSTDNGQSWVERMPSNYFGSPDRVAIAVSNANPDLVYAIAGPCTDSLYFAGFARSTNGGEDFQFMSDSPNILGYANNGNDSASQSFYDLCLAVHPNSSTQVFSGAINVWKSNSSGSSGSWQNVTQWQEDLPSTTSYCHADIHNIEFGPHDGAMYVCSDGGLYRSTNNGISFQKLSAGMAITQFYHMDHYEGNSYRMIGGTQDNGTNVRITNSGIWVHVTGADGSDCAINPLNPSTAYVTVNEKVYRVSQDGNVREHLVTGNSWPKVEIHASDTTKVFYSHVSGLRYIDVADADSVHYLDNANYARALKIAPSDPDIIYGAGSTQIHRTEYTIDDLWLSTTHNFSLAQGVTIDEIAVNPINAAQRAVCFRGFDGSNKVQRNVNGTWENITGSLPNLPVTAMVWAPGGSSGLYVGTLAGVYYRDDALGDWIPFRNGLPHAPVYDLKIHQSSGKIRAATYGRGIWESALYTACPNDISLSGPIQTGYSFVQAASTITSSQQYGGGEGTNVVYHAGQSITLTSGFEVAYNSFFEGLILPCNTTPDPNQIGPDVTGTYAGPMPHVADAVSSISDTDMAGAFKLFPNPAHDMVFIEFPVSGPEQVEVKLTDLSGREVMTVVIGIMKEGVYRTSADVSGLGAGVYLCVVSQSDFRQVRRLVVN